jgi:Protein of unknown function with HXXEE motif
MEMSFRNLQWLFPTVIGLHNLEEAIWLPGWWRRTGRGRVRLRPGAFRFGAAVLTVLAFALNWLSAVSGKQTIWTYLVFGYMAAMLANALVPHIAVSLALRGYMPGVVTAVVLNLPVLSLLVVLALKEGYVSGSKAAEYSLGVAALLLLSIPVLLKLGKVVKF